jgi:hypothetical protein
MERTLASRNIPAAWASSLTSEVWQDIVGRNRQAAAVNSFSLLKQRWFRLRWRTIALTIVFWIFCAAVTLELAAH